MSRQKIWPDMGLFVPMIFLHFIKRFLHIRIQLRVSFYGYFNPEILAKNLRAVGIYSRIFGLNPEQETTLLQKCENVFYELIYGNSFF